MIKELLKKEFNELDDEQIKLLSENIVIKKYKVGEIIFFSENECIGLLLIQSGKLRIFLPVGFEKEITLYNLFSGDICTLSASCLIGGINFNVSGECLENCELIIIKHNAIKSVLKNNIKFENKILKYTLDKFSFAMWNFEQILTHDLKSRIANFLIENFMEKRTNLVKLTHEQIAKNITSHRVAVSRILKQLEKDKIIKQNISSIEILNEKELKILVK